MEPLTVLRRRSGLVQLHVWGMGFATLGLVQYDLSHNASNTSFLIITVGYYKAFNHPFSAMTLIPLGDT